MVLALAGCSESSKSQIVTLPDATLQEQVSNEVSPNDVSLYKTKKVEEFLAFLESFNESQYEILDITTCMYTGVYTNGDFYMVTYQKLSEPREVKETGKVSLFKTKDEDEYFTFLSNFDNSKNEILGITTSMYTGVYTNGAFYMVTFRELK